MVWGIVGLGLGLGLGLGIGLQLGIGLGIVRVSVRVRVRVKARVGLDWNLTRWANLTGRHKSAVNSMHSRKPRRHADGQSQYELSDLTADQSLLLTGEKSHGNQEAAC